MKTLLKSPVVAVALAFLTGYFFAGSIPHEWQAAPWIAGAAASALFVWGLLRAGHTKTRGKIQDSRHFLDSVIENIPNMIFVKDARELRFVRFNRAGEELLGRSRQELVGKNDFDLFPREQAEFFTKKDRAVLDNRTLLDIPEEPLETPNGTRYLHTRKIPLLDDNGVPQYLLGISEDITQKKEAERQRMQLIEAQADRNEAERTASRLSFLAEASAALNASLDLRETLHRFAKVVVRHMADRCAVDLQDEEQRVLERVVEVTSPGRMQNGESDKEEGKAVGKAWESKVPELRTRDHLSVMAIPLLLDGKPTGVLTLASDGREYGGLDLSVAQDLAGRVAMAMENAKLFAKAQDANRAKSSFLANMSHEVRTPLGAMLGFAELALEDPELSEQQRQHLTTIMRNGQLLLRIVDEVLDLAKVESAHLSVEESDFSLSKLISDVESLLALKAGQKGLRLRVKTLGEVPAAVRTDPQRLRQILINMVGNAIKFTEVGEVRLEIACHPDGKGHGQLEFTVIDTGIGIPTREAEKLFHPFVQADATMARRYGGTGLGLFLSRKLARLLGGDVELVSSEPGKGSRFRITLHVGLPPALVSTALSARQPFRPLTGNVLVVDDSHENRVLVEAFLRHMGVRSQVASDGRRGVDKALEGGFDLVLMDLQMPVMDGFEALEILRQRGYTGPVVALTAHAMKGDRERCLESGFDDYLCKPINRQALEECLSTYLSPASSLDNDATRGYDGSWPPPPASAKSIRPSPH